MRFPVRKAAQYRVQRNKMIIDEAASLKRRRISLKKIGVETVGARDTERGAGNETGDETAPQQQPVACKIKMGK